MSNNNLITQRSTIVNEINGQKIRNALLKSKTYFLQALRVGRE